MIFKKKRICSFRNRIHWTVWRNWTNLKKKLSNKKPQYIRTTSNDRSPSFDLLCLHIKLAVNSFSSLRTSINENVYVNKMLCIEQTTRKIYFIPSLSSFCFLADELWSSMSTGLFFCDAEQKYFQCDFTQHIFIL